MFATNRRFSVQGRNLVLGKVAPPSLQSEVAVSKSSKGSRETASLFTGGLGYGMPNATNGLSVLGSGPLSVQTLLTGLVPEQEALLNIYYRDIYFHDAVAGAACDMISTFPFSDFTLMGVEDDKVLDKYEESVAHLNVRALMPQISLCYLVDGKFVGTLVFNTQDKIFHDTIVHSADSCVVDDIPLFSTDPSIVVSNNPMLMNIMSREDAQARLIRGMLGPKLVEALRSSRFRLDPASTLYISRRTVPNSEPTSYLKRILPIYLLEKTLYRGTLVEATRRQRAMLHIMMGDDNWEPTPQEMMAAVLQFQQADMDPLGAIVATRNAVQVSEVRQGGDFWKWSDNAETFVPLKLRALGISEAFMSGDANFSNTETAMSVFMENIDAYRSFLTHKTFDCKVFPMIAVSNDFYKDGKAPKTGSDKIRMLYQARNYNDLNMPTLRWHKVLKAKDEGDMYQALDYMAQKGIPVPLRMIFAAAKTDPNELFQDLLLDKRMKEKLGKAGGVDPTQINPGGDAGGDNVDGGGDSEFASIKKLIDLTQQIKKKPILARDFGELGEVKGQTKTGKPKYEPNQQKLNKEMNARIVQAATKLANDPNLHKAIISRVAKKIRSAPDMGLVPRYKERK